MQQRLLHWTPLHLLLRQQRRHQRRRRQLCRRHHRHKRLQTRVHHNRLLVPLLTAAIRGLHTYRRYVLFSQYSSDGVLRAFPLFLRGVAADWYDHLSDAVRGDAQQLEQAFLARYTPSDFTCCQCWVKVSDMFSRTHQASETFDTNAKDIPGC